MKMKKLLTAAMSCAIGLGMLGGCSGKGGKKLVMATNAAFQPYEYLDGNKIVGIDPEIMEEICKKLDMTLEIEDMDFESVIPAVQSGKADVGVAGLTVSEDRLEEVDFTDSYAKGIQVIIVKKENADDDYDPTGKAIGVQQGTTGDTYASDLGEGTKVERYNKGADAVNALKQDKIDCVIIDNEPAKVYVSKNDDLAMITKPFADEEYAIAVKKGNTELLEKLNGAIKELKDDGTIDKILEKYIAD